MIELKSLFDYLKKHRVDSILVCLSEDIKGDQKGPDSVIEVIGLNGEAFMTGRLPEKQGVRIVREYLEPMVGKLPPFKGINISYDRFSDGRETYIVDDFDSSFNLMYEANTGKKTIGMVGALNGKGYFGLPALRDLRSETHFHSVVVEDGVVHESSVSLELF